MDFKKFRTEVSKKFEMMSKHDMYRTKVGKDFMWQNYLEAFPEGTNPIYRKRSGHDCGCCKQFIRAVGDAVAIIDGKLVSIWDVTCGDPTYDAVAKKMSEVVKAFPIEDIFVHPEPKAGTEKSFEKLVNDVKTWDHFFVNIPNDSRRGKNFVVSGKDVGQRLGAARTKHDTLARALKEIKLDDVDTVLDLITQGSLYRGDEKKSLVTAFRKMKVEFEKLKTNEQNDYYVWQNITGPNEFVCNIRNDVIGTLLVDLAEGKDLDYAVTSFEQKVAPTNYKRPTALVTKAMIENAKKKVEELGLASALERRLATESDISVDDVIFANRNAKTVPTGNVFDDLTATKPTKTLDKVEEVTIDKFIEDILPRASSVEVMLENRLTPNLVTLVAPADPTAKPLFKWDNPFSWSYNGELADSIKERVKKAGGSVTGDVLCRLAWFNYDDLDLHMEEPGGAHIHYACYRQGSYSNSLSPSGGTLDVDMNAGGGGPGRGTRTPVENIFYADKRKMKEGVYKLYVNNYRKVESVDVGFEVEFEVEGKVHTFKHPKALGDGMSVDVVQFSYSHKDGIKILNSLPSTETTRQVWGLNTQNFQKVKLMLLSPNHWKGRGVGNKHYFFVLDGAKNDGKVRPFFNEFLRSDLEEHRKVFEMVGAKVKTEDTGDQLSGLGFSSTQRNSVIAKVQGAITRTIKILF